jgi:alkanesulfonate monooxygenase SsuD/methylene tetrahydromethanopterin reductase-like flavin-dependent oxidoreductase (luciferase family)
VYRYHDTFPHPDWVPSWPELIPDPTIDEVRAQIGASGVVLGDPDDALKACQQWADAGADQLVFGQGMATQEEALETIRLMGEHVIPKIDKDPEFRTNLFRSEAAAKL